MHILNLLDYPLAAILMPFHGFHPFFALTVLCVLFGLTGMFIFRKTTNQDRLKEIQQQIKLLHMEMRFRWNDLSEVLSRQNRVFRLNGRYLRYSLPATVWILIPIVSALIVMDSYFCCYPIRPGQIFTVSVENPGSSELNAVVLEDRLPDSIRFIEREENPDADGPIHFVFRANGSGTHNLFFSVKGEEISKTVSVGKGIQRVNRTRGPASFLDSLYSPGEPPLPKGSKITALKIGYTAIQFPLSIFGWHPGWFSYFIILSLVLILVFKKWFSVY